AFDGVKTQFKEDIKDLDDDAMRQKVKEELNSLIRHRQRVYEPGYFWLNKFTSLAVTSLNLFEPIIYWGSKG
ncbi:hypothetical protein RRG08_006427, partial [Elysia crispata]